MWPGFDVTIPAYASTAASIAGTNAIATTYHVSCLDGADEDKCHIETPWTLIQGDNTMSFTGVYTASHWLNDGSAVTVTRELECSFTHSSESASCSFSYQATGSNDGVKYAVSTSASTSSFPPKSIHWAEMEVTGGVASLTAPQATQTPGAAAVVAAKPLITAAPLGAAAAIAVAAMF